MKMKALLSTLALSFAIGGAAHAQDYPGGNISIVVPYGTGGGFDTAVRTFAPYFADELGSNTNVITENVSGAGGQRGAAEVYRANPDGRKLGIFNLPGFALPAILGEELNYDLQELSWIGRLESQDYVLLVNANSDIHNLDDLMAQDEIVITSTGYGSTVLAGLQITMAALGLEDRDPIYLSGYPSTSDQLVGLVRGDGNVSMAPHSSSASYIRSGDLRPIASSGTSSPYDGVQTFEEAGYPELTPLNLQRSIAGPPGISEDRLQILREAFARAVENPDFLADAERVGMDIAPLDGDDTAAEVNTSFDFYERFSTSLGNPNE